MNRPGYAKTAGSPVTCWLHCLDARRQTLRGHKYMFMQNLIQRPPKDILFVTFVLAFFLCALCVKLDLDLILNSFLAAQ
jgi:hypothetical protein